MQEGPQMQDSDSDVVLGRDVKSKNNSVPLTAAAQAVSAKNSKFQEAQHASLFDLRDLPARMPVDRPERSPVVRQPSEEQHQPHLQHGHSNKKTLWSCCVRPKVEGDHSPPDRNHIQPMNQNIQQKNQDRETVVLSQVSDSDRPSTDDYQVRDQDAMSVLSESMWYDPVEDPSTVVADRPAPSTSQQAVPAAPRAVVQYVAPPNPPLIFGEENKAVRFVRVPAVTGYAGYWLRDNIRTTQAPTPIDVMLNLGAIVHKSRDTIPGMWLQENEKQFTITVKPGVFSLVGSLALYTETFNKDGSINEWRGARRDLNIGRSFGQMYMTDDNRLVLRVVAKGMFSNKVEYITEEYMSLETDENGNRVIVAYQCGTVPHKGKTARQYLVGTWLPKPPKGHV
eukprot:jgi/Chrzof1/13733/Cz08g10030.t1